jgi:hypothetical protein
MSEPPKVDEGLDGFVLALSELETPRSLDALWRQHIHDLVVGRIRRRSELAIYQKAFLHRAGERDNALKVHGAWAREEVARPMDSPKPRSKAVDGLLGCRRRDDHLKRSGAVFVIQNFVVEETAEIEALRRRRWLSGSRWFWPPLRPFGASTWRSSRLLPRCHSPRHTTAVASLEWMQDRAMANVTVSREELYEQVWSMPMLRLALQYGVSSVALGKTCRRLNIPAPGRGYWARVAAGERLKRSPLAKSTGQQAWYRLECDPSATPITAKAPAPEVDVASTLESAHVTTRRASLLAKASVDEHNRIVVAGECMAVTIETHRRALLLVDSLAKAFERRGDSVELILSEANTFKLVARIANEAIAFSVSERLERTERKQADIERERAAKGNSARIPKYDYWPGGRLRIDVLENRLARSMWCDTETRPVERTLGQVIVGIDAAVAERQHVKQEAEQRRLEQEQRAREAAERKAREAEAAALEREKQKLVEYRTLLANDLERVAARWTRARQIRDFADAYDAALVDDQRTELAVHYLEAVRRYATNLNPLSEVGHIALELEPKGEALDLALANMRQLEAKAKREQQS